MASALLRLQNNLYYFYGLPESDTEMPQDDAYGYSGKVFSTTKGLNFYDFGARTYVPDECRFWQPDPNSGDYHWLSPYAYCAGDPVNKIDPTGCSTWVINQGDGIYKVVGGCLDDNDYNIYVIRIADGNMAKEMSIGVTPTITSFYNSDTKEWATNSYIDTKDNSGIDFLDNMTGDNIPGLFDYICNARTGCKYDFKVTNGTESKPEKNWTHIEVCQLGLPQQKLHCLPRLATLEILLQDISQELMKFLGLVLAWHLTYTKVVRKVRLRKMLNSMDGKTEMNLLY